MDRLDYIKQKLSVVPNEPGCYLMKDDQGVVIYVGKAKILRNRVRSYFTGAHDDKTTRLVSFIHDFEYIVTASEVESLLLELNLIKKYKPHFNINLKDDKSYPFIKITKETHPRLIVTRQVKKGTGYYFGPYPNAYSAHETKKLLDQIYPMRKCNKMPDKLCLYYHIGQCLGPCVYPVEQSEYDRMKKEISDFLNGENDDIVKQLEAKMYKSSEAMEFERAKEYRDLIQHINSILYDQNMMSTDMTTRDIFGFAVDKGWMSIQVFYIRQGKLIERKASLIPIYQSPEDEFYKFIGQFYLHQNEVLPREVHIPNGLDAEMLNSIVESKVIQPKRGKKKEMVDLAIKNAKISLSNKFELIAKNEERTIKAIEMLGEVMHIRTPFRIEAFDNSNIQGVDPVSAMVSFIDGKPSKKDYRKYKIKSVEGPDDYASMKEVIRRRYSRVLRDELPIPDLIIVDGGIGHMRAAQDVLTNELSLDIPVAGLVKNDKHKTSELLYGDAFEVVPLNKKSQAFYLLQRIQDEVHRFAIDFHRKTRSKTSVYSLLDNIDGIGPKRKKQLLNEFKSIKNMKTKSVDELKSVGLPIKVAESVYSKLHEDEG